MSLCNLALLYEHRSQYHEALELYRKSLEVDPRYARAEEEAHRITHILKTT